MNLRRIKAVVVARNREFYRDKADLGWNIFVPVMMLFSFAFIFSNSDETLYQIGILGDASNTPIMALRHVQLVELNDQNLAIDKLRHHKLDLLVDVRNNARYWVNELSAKSYAAEQILLQQYNSSPAVLQRDTIDGQSIRYVDWLVPGILGMNIMFSSLWGVGWVVVRYRKNGVLRRLRATPLTASEFLIAQIISRLMIVVIVNVLVFAGTLAVLDFPMRGSYLALLLVLLSGAIALISLGLAIAARVSSEELASGLLNVFAVPMMILSGVWFSVDASNIWVQRIADILPLTHMVEAARRIMLDGVSLGDVMFEIILLAIMALVLLVGSAKAFRWQ